MSSRNTSLVRAFLKGVDKPVSAYDILDALRCEGIRAPLQIYRALAKLIETGEAHRIESLNAFVACRKHDCSGREVSVFMLCKDCEKVTEMADIGVSNALDSLCSTAKFDCTKRVIEITGACGQCIPVGPGDDSSRQRRAA